ncbi:hypothetical protein E8D73_27605 [Escherichia coli]|uniref:Uncharacterized protein n=1 Tax=Escherichia coli TaxID=562 RepID=A0A6L6I2I0_ECOLX|nr:hypothetical protein [Escherichia coli]MDJ1278150.1 hypothetical protein [Escherichia coli]MTE89426.1 hypothetical protein [Escherichia coli]PCM38173.1 hypothetical protein B1028_09860 [Escherichia coli]HAG8765828.1 hypothetical protein [Escherichia coli]
MIRFVTRNNCGFIKAPEIELSEQDDSQRASFRGFMTETPVTGAHRAKRFSQCNKKSLVGESARGLKV